MKQARALDVFPEPIPSLPYEMETTDAEDRHLGDHAFWDHLSRAVRAGFAGLLAESHVAGAGRWRLLTPGTVDAMRARTAPHARSAVSPHLYPDHDAVIAPLPAEGLLNLHADKRSAPLFTAVVPEDVGALQARWRAEATESDCGPGFLRIFQLDDLVTGTVTRIADFGVSYVDIGGLRP
ncbi:hypothetical protein [Streptomyces lonarensis]|uniref:Uncharacterized protein n=1 Tax=Streptomyces lonarensis TaxID=700599 RepID=A0A7X6CZV9_9ACTN|nr:hypothetical protein [Streptomyces lonarensis]NJQ05509.1 hypothetical protein [Streptomyces lonarensis]